MNQVYRFCGLGVAFIEQQMPPEQRKKVYTADVTYCANKEVTADFLRDRLALSKLRGLSSALAAKIAGTGSGLNDRLAPASSLNNRFEVRFSD